MANFFLSMSNATSASLIFESASGNRSTGRSKCAAGECGTGKSLIYIHQTGLFNSANKFAAGLFVKSHT